jgi:hypothetical protein
MNRKKAAAVTSDQWHVVHARWSGEAADEPRFLRSIVSEHEDGSAALTAARKILSTLSEEMSSRPRETRDQILVRRPGYKSLKNAKRVEKRSK